MNGVTTRFGKHAAMIQLVADQLRQLPGEKAEGIEPRLLAKSLDHIAADLIAASLEPDRLHEATEPRPEQRMGLACLHR